MRFEMLLLLIFLSLAFSENLTSSEDHLQNLTFSSEEIEDDHGFIKIPWSSEEQDSPEDTPESTPSPYLPLLVRCSSDFDCSADRSCQDGKCHVAPRGFGFLPRLIRCTNRMECPAGHKCLLMKCFPFRW